MKRSTLTSVALIGAIATGLMVTAAAANDRGHGRGQMDFATLDADGDGQITQAEIEAMAAARFAEVDTDGNGAVTAEELAAQAEARNAERLANRTARMIAALDEDDSGDLSAEELAARGPGAERFFERFDEDGDGAVSEEEFEAAKAARGDRRHGGGKNGPRGDGEGRDRDDDQG